MTQAWDQTTPLPVQPGMVQEGEPLSERPFPRVILATGNANAIAQANPDAVVLDFEMVEYPTSLNGMIGTRLASRVLYQGAAEAFTMAQFKLLAMLLAARGRLLTKPELADAMWGDDETGGPEDKVIDVMLCKLRPRLNKLGLGVITVWGRGLRATIGQPKQRRGDANSRFGSHTYWDRAA